MWYCIWWKHIYILCKITFVSKINKRKFGVREQGPQRYSIFLGILRHISKKSIIVWSTLDILGNQKIAGNMQVLLTIARGKNSGIKAFIKNWLFFGASVKKTGSLGHESYTMAQISLKLIHNNIQYCSISLFKHFSITNLAITKHFIGLKWFANYGV